MKEKKQEKHIQCMGMKVRGWELGKVGIAYFFICVVAEFVFRYWRTSICMVIHILIHCTSSYVPKWKMYQGERLFLIIAFDFQFELSIMYTQCIHATSFYTHNVYTWIRMSPGQIMNKIFLIDTENIHNLSKRIWTVYEQHLNRFGTIHSLYLQCT